jgi:hypothetical protein
MQEKRGWRKERQKVYNSKNYKDGETFSEDSPLLSMRNYHGFFLLHGTCFQGSTEGV